MLFVLLVFTLLFLCFAWLARRGITVPLRPIEAYETLRGMLGRALETDRSLHISMGTAGLGGRSTAETIAGLTILEHLAEHTGFSYVAPFVTVSDPTLLPAAQDVIRRGHARHGPLQPVDLSRVRYISSDPVAYASGVAEILMHENLAGNIMVGALGHEFLLMSEVGTFQGLEQVGGVVAPETLALAVPSTDYTLLGEEIFAAGAYLAARASHLGSLRAQDWLRWAIVLVIIGGVVARTVGWI
jgi:hypothetical protein